MIPACLARALIGMPLIWFLTAASLPVSKPEDVGLSSERLQRIHEVVMRHVDAQDISGAVTLVARKGHVVHFEAHGLMDIESKKPMTKDALFRLASSSKPITAAAVLMLLEEGKLKLTDPVSKFIPEFRDSKVAIEYQRPPIPMSAPLPPAASPYYTVPASRDITIVDLLTHTSGLASGGITDADSQKILKSRKPTDTLADFIPRLGALPLDFQPGTEWRYSGVAGFDTLGRIVEIVSGMSFDQFLRERLFDPLDMRDTGFNVPEARRRAQGDDLSTNREGPGEADQLPRIRRARLFLRRRRPYLDRRRLLQVRPDALQRRHPEWQAHPEPLDR